MCLEIDLFGFVLACSRVIWHDLTCSHAYDGHHDGHPHAGHPHDGDPHDSDPHDGDHYDDYGDYGDYGEGEESYEMEQINAVLDQFADMGMSEEEIEELEE